MKILTILSLLIALAAAANWQLKPRVYSLDAGLLQKSKARLNVKDAALDALRRDAEKALSIAPFSVMQKERTPPSGDKHDYLSLAPYWWPDPKTKDGLPYIRRDGETNPDSKRGTDAPALAAMGSAVETLGLAYYFTGEEKYADRATAIIRAWFIDPATHMNPNFRYAQAVLGHNEGRGTGLIESRQFIKVVESAGLLGGSRAWSQKDEQALVGWFREFANWMQTSAHGKDEAKARNNHGSWYAAQLACYALFVGDEALARKTANEAKARIAWQIEADGKQPEELARTRAMGYSTFNLSALMTLAEVAKKVGVDLYSYQTKDGRGIRRGIDFLAPYADTARKWPYPQINEMENAQRDLAYLLRRAAIAYNEPKYEELLAQHLAGEIAQQRWQLLWPK